MICTRPPPDSVYRSPGVDWNTKSGLSVSCSAALSVMLAHTITVGCDNSVFTACWISASVDTSMMPRAVAQVRHTEGV